MACNPYYFVLQVPDGGRSQTFFNGLFGWEYDDHGHIANVAAPGAVVGGAAEPSIDVYISLDGDDDVAGRAQLIESLGGRTEPLVDSPTGVSSRCRDPQGGTFAIGWERPEFLASWDQPSERASGELGFISLPSADLRGSIEFYTSVFDWVFDEPDAAHAAGGFGHTGTPTPDIGLHPPGDHFLPQLYFRVPDVKAACRRVGELGGSPGIAHSVGSGVNAECQDDQGLSFSLWKPAAGYG